MEKQENNMSIKYELELDVGVSEDKLMEFADDLTRSLVGEDSNTFMAARGMLRDAIEDTELDSRQKAGVLAGFLKSSYEEVNRQAMGVAYDVLMMNEKMLMETKIAELELDGKYKMAEVEEEKGIEMDSEIESLGYEIRIMTDEVDKMKLQQLEMRMKLKKVYGVEMDGTNSATDGTMDEQIREYDKVNSKDGLKTIEEMEGLMINAQACPPDWLKATMKVYIKDLADSTDVSVLVA